MELLTREEPKIFAQMFESGRVIELRKRWGSDLIGNSIAGFGKVVVQVFGDNSFVFAASRLIQATLDLFTHLPKRTVRREFPIPPSASANLPFNLERLATLPRSNQHLKALVLVAEKASVFLLLDLQVSRGFRELLLIELLFVLYALPLLGFSMLCSNREVKLLLPRTTPRCCVLGVRERAFVDRDSGPRILLYKSNLRLILDHAATKDFLVLSIWRVKLSENAGSLLLVACK
jgi:hypothetical protein